MTSSEPDLSPSPPEGDDRITAGSVPDEGPGEPGSSPVQAADGFEQQLLEALARAPYGATSILLHVLVYLLVFPFVFLDRPLPQPAAPLTVTTAVAEPEDPLEEPWTFDAPLPEIPDPRPDLEDVSEGEEDPGPEFDLAEGSFPFDLVPGTAMDPRKGEFEGLEMHDGLWGSDFGQHVERLRREGLDVVFLFDSTSSMWPVIDAVKDRIGWMISVLQTLVPGFRLGIATYRDRGDEYVVRGEPLTTERFRLMAYVQEVEAGGGGDVEEAVLAGLEYCVYEMPWAPGAHRVIVLIGDAPPHPNEVRRAIETAQSFRRRGGVVHTLVPTEAPQGRGAGGAETTTLETFGRIAQAGDGVAVTLAQAGDIVEELLVLAVGSEWREPVERAFHELRERGTWKDRWIRRKTAAGDLAAVVAKLRQSPVFPGIVRALLELPDPDRAVPDLLQVAGDPHVASENRWAALYLLRRITGRSHPELQPSNLPELTPTGSPGGRRGRR